MLHAAAWTDVDGAEDDPQGAAAVNVGGTQHARRARRAARVLLDRLRLRRDEARRRTSSRTRRARSPSYGRTKLHGEAAAGEDAWIVRTSWLFGWTGTNFVRTMLAARRGARRGRRSSTTSAARPTFVGHLAEATHELVELPYGRLARRRRRRLHVGRVRGGDLRGGRARLPRAADHDRRARTPGAAAGVLRAAERARGAPRLPHWRDGLRACLDRLSVMPRGGGRDDRVADLVVQAALEEERGRARVERLRATSRSCDRPLTASTRSAGVVREQLLRQLEAVHPGHREIDERDVRVLGVGELDRAERRRRRRRRSRPARRGRGARGAPRGTSARRRREARESAFAVAYPKRGGSRSGRARSAGPLQLSVLLRVPLAAA